MGGPTTVARLVIGMSIAGLLAGCASGVSGSPAASATTAPSVPPTGASSPVPGNSPTPATTPAVGVDWARLPNDEAMLGGADNQWMAAVVAGGPGLVAVGLDRSGGDEDAAVWTSVDGLHWARAAHDEATFGGPGPQWMNAVAAGGPGLVGVGSDASGGEQDAAVWTSPDGLAWTRVTHDEATFGGSGDQWMNSVAADGQGLVAVGGDISTGESDAAAWTSVDGIAWARVATAGEALGGAGDQRMHSVVGGGPGLVAVGIDAAGGDADVAVWTSAGGDRWTRITHEEAVFGGAGDQWANSVAVGGPGFVTVGGEGTEETFDAAAWTSVDGVVWARVDDVTALGGTGDQWLNTVTGGGPGLVAVGGTGSEGEYDGAAWTSVDGLTWGRVPPDSSAFGGPGDQVLVGATRGGPGLVAVGYDGSIADQDAAVWLSPPPPGLPEPPAVPSATTIPSPQPVPASWERSTSANLGYSLALPPGSYLGESVQWQAGQGPYDQWMVASPDGGLAFGLMIGHDAQPKPGSTLPPAGAGGATDVQTSDGVRVLVGEASGINIMAFTVRDDYWWLFIAESGDIVGDDAKRSLLLQIISTFRFAGPDFVPPTPVPTASP